MRSARNVVTISRTSARNFFARDVGFLNVLAGLGHRLANLRRPVGEQVMPRHQREVPLFDLTQSLILSRGVGDAGGKRGECACG